MTSREAKARFESLLSRREHADHPETILSRMLEFYRDERVEDCLVEQDGDMLLYQWGTYDWGQGPWFDLNITRQFIPVSQDQADIFQLSVSAKYTPGPELDALGSGNQWCHSPDDFVRFHEFVLQSPALTHLTGKPCAKVEITYNQAG